MPLTQRSRGGEIPKTLKISEVAEKINSIQVGGGMVDLTKSEHMSLENFLEFQKNPIFVFF